MLEISENRETPTENCSKVNLWIQDSHTVMRIKMLKNDNNNLDYMMYIQTKLLFEYFERIPLVIFKR